MSDSRQAHAARLGGKLPRRWLVVATALLAAAIALAIVLAAKGGDSHAHASALGAKGAAGGLAAQTPAKPAASGASSAAARVRRSAPCGVGRGSQRQARERLRGCRP